MSQTFLPAEWLKQLSDPYAVLGIAVTADERQILTRYRILAKLLHPDRCNHNQDVDQKLVTAIFTSLINPAYAQLKHKKQRSDIIETLRLEAITRKKLAKFRQNSVVQQFMAMSAQEADLSYQQAIASYAENQYKSLHKSYQITQQIITLNLVYLCLQKPESGMMQVNTPVKPKEKSQPPEVETTKITLNEKVNVTPAVINYAQRHYQRAVDYTKQGHWAVAVQELRDAIRIEPNNSDYYALLGFVHLRQKFLGMAKVYMRQALKLNPQQQLALKYADYLKINSIEHIDPPSMAKALGIAALLSKFVGKVETNFSQVLKFR